MVSNEEPILMEGVRSSQMFKIISGVYSLGLITWLTLQHILASLPLANQTWQWEIPLKYS